MDGFISVERRGEAEIIPPAVLSIGPDLKNHRDHGLISSA
jgi:hypothetical protein